MKKTSKYQKSTFVKNLIARRKLLGMSALEFAEFADIKYPTLRDIEHGSSAGSLKTIQKIAKALSTTIDEMNTPMGQITSQKASIPYPNVSTKPLKDPMLEELRIMNRALIEKIAALEAKLKKNSK